MKFKSDIEVQAGLKDSSGAIGTSGQLLSSTVTGVSWTSINGFVPYTGATQDVNLGVHTLLAQDLVINHSNGSGVAASITKNGSGEALTVIKGSGSGRAASITGGVTLISELNLTTSLADAYIASAAIWNAKQNALNGTGFVKVVGTTVSYDNSTYVPTSRTLTINGVTQDLSANRSFTVATHDAVTIGTANGLSLSGQVLSLDLSGPDSEGALSSTDWNTFNNKIGGSGNTNYIPKFTGTRTLGYSQIFDNGTNVGINTTSLNAKFTVENTASGSLGTGIVIRNSASTVVGTESRLFLSTVSGDNRGAYISAIITSSSNDNALLFGTNTAGNAPSTKMTLDPLGNLGLGVTPSAWGVTAFQRGSTSLFEYGTNNSILSSNFYYLGGASNLYMNNGFASFYQQYNGQHAWYTAPSGTAGNAISFTQAMTLGANGNLLLGTTTDAGFKLDVNGTGRFSVSNSISGTFNRNTSSGATLAIQVVGSTVGTLGSDIGGNGIFDISSVSNGVASNGVQISRSGGTPTAFFSPSGNVGIGTISPNEKLVVSNGVIKAENTTLGTGINLHPNADFGNGALPTLQVFTNHALQFATNNTLRLTIASTGAATFASSVSASSFNANVSSFGTDISVNSTIRVGSGFATQASIIFGDAGTPYWSVGRPAGSGNLNISSYALTALTIQPTTGNVGIGTTSPTYRLDVTSSGFNVANFNSTFGQMAISFANSGNIFAQIGSGNSVTPTATFDDLGFGTAGLNKNIVFATGSSFSERMRITSGGNVLIGTASDNGHKLRVNGTISADSVALSGNYSAYIPTDSSWSSPQTMIPTGALQNDVTYMISVQWHFGSGSNQPYYYNCAFLWMGASTNGTSNDGDFFPIGSTHTGGTGSVMAFRSFAGVGGTSSGIKATLNGFPTRGGNILVKATKLQ